MGQGITLFRQLQAEWPRTVFDQAVRACRGDYKVQKASCWSHGLCLMLGLLLHCQSLRDLQTALACRRRYLQRFGLGSADKSTVSRANAHRPSVVMEAVFEALWRRVQAVAPSHRFRFRHRVVSMDATVMAVSARLFPWARCAPTESGIKLHVLLDHHGLVPRLVEIKTLRQSELKLAQRRRFARGQVLCFDRGYFHSGWLQQLTDQGVLFVTRLPPRLLYRVIRRRPVNDKRGVVADEIIVFTGVTPRACCCARLRLVTYHDAAAERTLHFLTNQMTWSAWTICQIYKDRWQIELFFKWLKQHLKVTTFYSRDENGVRWQLLMALCLYLLLATLKYGYRLKSSLWQLHRLLERHLFDRVALEDLLFGHYQFQT
jgi:hypothetical protein